MKLSPNPAPTSRRVFIACLLSFTILMTPLAAIAAPRNVGSTTVREGNLAKTTGKDRSKSSAREGLVSPPLAPPQPFAPIITATKVDSLENDDGDNKIDPTNGVPATTERIRYTVTINNTGSDATGVAFTDTIDSHTTLVGGSVDVSPLALNDSYDTIGNTLLEVGPVGSPSAQPKVSVTGSVFDNDTEFLGDTFTLSKLQAVTFVSGTVTATSANSGTVVMDGNGKFSYTPNAGFTGADTFTYTIKDSQNLEGTATVTINVNAQKVWYVKNDVAGPGTGTSTNPFNTLVQAQTASAAGDTIYVFTGTGTTTGQNAGITLKANQRFIGNGVQLDVPVSVNGGPNPTVLRAAGAAPSITNTAAGGNGVTVSNIAGVSIRGFIIGGNLNAVAASFNTAGGGVTISNNSIAGGTANAIDVTTTITTAGGCTATITNNTITAAGAEGIDINGQGNGGITLDLQSNAVTSTGNGIDINGVSGGTLNITAFANNTVSGTSGANGIIVQTAKFDATPGGNLDTVSGGVTTIGASGNGVGGNGLVLINTTGNLSFTDLDVFADGGFGLQVQGAGVLTATTGTGLAVGSGVGSVTTTNGSAIDIQAATIDLQTFAVTSSGGTDGVSLTNGVFGTFSSTAGSTIASASSDDFVVGSGTANITWNGPLSGSTGHTVNVTGHTGGTVAFTGAITDTGTGILLSSNTGATINFTGGLSINTGANAAFTATGGGTVSATQNNTSIVNTLATTTATALNVTSTTIGASGLTFRSITSNGSGAANGIILNSAGTGGLTVTGSGGSCTTTPATCTGGAISNKTGADGTGNGIGIFVNNTSNVSITRMKFNDFSNYAIRGTAVTGFTMNNCFIDGVNGDNAGADEGSVIFDGLLGTSSFSSDTIKGGIEDNFRVRNSSGTANNIAIDSCTIRDTSTGVTGNDNLIIEASGTAAVTAHVTNNIFAATNGDHIQINTLNSATMNIVITGNFYSGGGGVNALLQGITISGGNAGSTEHVSFNISNNGTSGNPLVGNIQGGAINVNEGQGAGIWQGQVSNNFIGNAGVANSGSAQSSGIRVENHSTSGTLTAIIDGNTVRQWNNGPAINTQAGDAGNASNTGVVNLTVTNNTSTNPGAGSQHGFVANIGAGSGSNTAANVACVDVRTNTLDGNLANGGSGVRIRHREVSTVKIPGYTGTQYDTAAVIAFETTKNPASTPAPTASTSSLGPGFGNTPGPGNPCAQPTIITMYRPQNHQRDYLARADEGLQQNSADTLFSMFDTRSDIASIFDSINRTTPLASLVRRTAGAQSPLLKAVATAEAESNLNGSASTPSVLGGAMNSLTKLAGMVDSLIVPTAHAEKAEGSGQRSEARDQRSEVRLNHANSRRAGTTKAATHAMAPVGPDVNVTIGNLPANKSVTITFTVTLNNPPNLSLLNPPRVRNQGTVTATGGISVLTDDTAVGGASDPTDTPVDLFDTTTNLVSDLNPSNFGDQITFTATVSESPAQGSVDPTGTVNFIDTSNGNAVICSAVALVSGQAQCQTSSLTASTHNMQAVYSGDGNFDTSTSNTVAQVVNPCLTNPIVTSTADSGANTLRDSLANVCSAPNNNVTFNLGAGPHTITALSTLVIAKNVNVTNTLGAGNGPLTVTANGGNFRVFRIDSPVTTASLSNFTVTGASVTGANGGGLLVQNGTATLTGMLFTGNTVINGAGGGVGVTGGATVNLRNSTISGNTATFGGGIYNNGGTLNLLNVTVTNNTADGNIGGGPIGGAGAIGGGIETGAGIATNVKNSIVAGNFATTGSNISGTATDQGNNILSGDPLIAALADNGGATRTHALLPTSPAVDAGDNTAATAIPLTTDQRGAGFPRIADSADADSTATVDIGAFELHPSIEDIPDKNTPEDTPLSFSFNIGDGTGALIASVIATSSNTTLVPNDVAHLSVTGAGSSRTLNITPATNANTAANGTATITVTVTATNGQTAQDTFVLTVDAVNDPPSFVKGADQTVNEDAGAQTVNGWATSISKGAADESGQTLTFNITPTGTTGGLTFSSGPAIDPTTGNLTYTPTADSNGTATFSVTLSDNGSNTPPSSNTSGAQTFMITVNAINDPPSFTKGADPNINENAGPQTVVGWATNISDGPNETGQILTFNVTANGTTGSLTFSTPPAINATTGTLTYTPNNGTNGTATFNVTLSDNGSNVPPNSNTSAVQSFTITVDSVNDPPVNTVPGAQSIPKNTVFTFSGANLISVADPDAAQAPSDGVILVTLTATNGTISLSGTAGLDFSCGSCAGDGVADTTMTFAGTIPAINTALNGASFTPTLNYTGPATVQIISNDLGKTGPGGPQTDTDTINFTVNDLLNIYLNEINFNPPGTDAPNEYIELRGTPSSVIPAGTYFVAIEGDGADNPGDVQTIINLSGLTFGSNGFLVILQAGNTYTTAAGATVITGTTTGFGGLPGNIFTADAGATDIEDASASFMLIQSGVAPALTDDIDADNNGTTDGSVFPGWSVRDSINVMNGSANARAYGAFGYRNSAGTGTSLGAEVIVSFIPSYVGRIGDSTGSTAADWVASGVLGGAAPNWTLGTAAETEPASFAGKPLNHIGASNFVNLPPVNTVPGAQNVNEDFVLTFNAGNANLISISDPDAGSAVVKVTLTAVNGTFSLSGIAGLSFTTGDGTNDTQMVFTGTIANINTALNNLTFTPPANFFSPPVASLTILTEDQGNTGVGGNQTDSDTINITVNAVNDPPSFTLSGNPPAVNEDAGAQTVNSFATGMSQGPGESGQTLTFNVSANGTTGNIAFSSAPAIDSSTGTLTYTTSANTNGTATFNVTLSDNGSNAAPNSNTSGVQQFTITVNAVNDAPTFQILSNPPAVNEDAPAQTVNSFATNFQPGPVTATDEAGQTLVGYTVTANGTTGNLTFTSAPSISNAGTLTYTPTGNTSGTATFNVVATDSGSGIAPNVNQSAAVSFTITVTGQNDAPVLDNTGNMTLTAINEDVPNASNPGTLVSDIIASAGGDRITDADAGALEGIAVIAVDNTNGAWQFSIDNGVNWTAFGSPNATTARLLASDALTRVRFIPNLNFNGTVDPGITFRAWDQTSGTNGNTADPSVNGGTTAFSTATETAAITVIPVNDNPTTIGIPPVNVNEDAADTVIDLRLFYNDVEDGPAGLVYTVTGNTNPALFTSTLINNANDNLTLDYAPNANGSAQLTIRGADTGGLFVETTLNVTVSAINDPPSFTKGADQTVNEDAGPQTVAGWATSISQGPGESGQTLTFNVSVNSTTGNLAFSSAPAVNSSTGTLTYTTSANTNGTATINVSLSDNGSNVAPNSNTSAVQQFTITVNAVNDAPTFQIVSNPPAANEDAGAQTVNSFATNFQPGPATATDEVGQTLVGYTVTQTGATGGLTFSSGPSINNAGQLTYTTSANTSGTATFNVVATDSGSGTAPNVNQSAPVSFTITVNAVNDVPSFTKGPDITVQDPNPQTFANWATNISAGPPDESGQTLTFLVSNNANGLFSAQPAISPNGTLTFTAAAGQDGVATVTVRLMDNGGTANGGVDTSAPQTFTLTVHALNNPPTLDAISDLTINEDAPLQTVNLSGITPGPSFESNQTLTITATSSNPALIPNPTVNYTNPNTTGSLTFTPVANISGTATITVTLKDTGGTANGGVDTFVRTFLVTVNSVNDAPSFTKGPDQTVNEDAGAQTVNNWATAISSGPANESGQTLEFQVTGNTNTALFAAGPAISPTGILTYTSAPDANGTATITIVLKDNGGTANGGVDTSAPQTFTITVNAINDAPVNHVPGAQNIPLNASFVFSTGTGNAISISDVDAGSDALQVTLKATDGTLTLNGTAGLSFTTGDGTDDPLMTFTGNLASINAALQGMKNLAFGSGVITITTNDLGHNGAGGPLSDTDTIQVTVADNLAPQLLTIAGTDRAIAFESTSLVIDPFNLQGNPSFTADSRTHIMLFALHAQLRPGETASAITAVADVDGTLVPLIVESVNTVPNFDFLTQIVIKFPDGFSTGGGGPHDAKIRITLRGQTSNQAIIIVVPAPKP